MISQLMPKIYWTRFPISSPLTEKMPTCWQQVVVMEFGKWHDTTDTTDFCPCQLVADLLRTCCLCCGLATGKSPTCYGLATGKLV